MSSFIDIKANRVRLQQALIDAGYDVGPDGADGDLGQNSAKAVAAFRKAHGLSEAAVVDARLLRALNLSETNMDTIASGNWLSSLVASTAGKYLVTFLATWLASKLGLDPTTGHVTLEGVLVQLVGVAAGIWGMWEASRSKVVVNGAKVPLKALDPIDQAVISDIVDKHK